MRNPNVISAGIFKSRSAGFAAAILGIAALTLAGAPLRESANDTVVAMAFLLVVLGVATVWGLWPGRLAAFLGILCFDFFFVPPIGSLAIADRSHWFSLAAFLITASTAGHLSVRAKLRTAEAHKSAEEVHDLYNHAPCGYHSLDKNRVFVRINDTELEWLGYTREEVVGTRQFTDVLTPESAETFTIAFARLKVEGLVQEIELEMLRKDSTVLPVLLSATAITDRYGNYILSRGVVYDITARKREEQTLARLASIVEFSDDAVFSMTLGGDVLTWNGAAERMFGFPAREIMERRFAALVPEAEQRAWQGVLEALRRGDSTERLEVVLIRKDGQPMDAALTLSPIRDVKGRVVSASCIARDITLRKRDETEIRLLAGRQATLAALGQQALRSDQLVAVLNEAAALVAKTVEVEFGAVFELLLDNSAMVLRAGSGWSGDAVGTERVESDSNSQAGLTLLLKVPVLVEDLANDARFPSSPLLLKHGIISGVTVLISTNQGPYGVLGVYTRQKRSFRKDEVEFLQAVANLLSISIERHRVNEELLRINRAYRALSGCNEVLIRASDEAALLLQICRVVVDEAGYHLCMVARAEQDASKSIKLLASAGYDESYLQTLNFSWADTPRGRGTMGTAIRTGVTQIVKNIPQDPRLAPWRSEALKLGCASAVSIPLLVNGTIFGALTICSSDIDAFGPQELALMTELAGDLGFGISTLRIRAERERAEEEVRMLNAQLESRVISRTAELQAANRQLEQAREREGDIGFRIQQSLLLDQPPRNIPGLEAAALTTPSQRIDGDFYIFLRHSDACLDIVVGDVMGKGIPAALLGAATKSHFLKALTDLTVLSRDHKTPEPSDIVMLAHAELVPHLIDLDSFVTLVYLRLDIGQGSLELVDCGHTGVLHLHSRTGQCEILRGDNLPLGVREGEIYEQKTVHFEPGDLLFLFSDGVTEARNTAGELFGVERLKQWIITNGDMDPRALVEDVRKAVLTFSAPNRLADDLTCLAVRVQERQLPLARSEINIVSELANLRQAREFVRTFCGNLDGIALDEASLNALDLAVNEAASNIMKHAYQGRTDQSIHMEAEAFPGHVTIRLHHAGDPFDPSVAPPPALDGTRESGFGAYIISRCVDDVRYFRDERGRNCIELIKCRTGSRQPAEGIRGNGTSWK